MVDFSKFPYPEWDDEHERQMRELWAEGLTAFWLCPEGIEKGIDVHDHFLAASATTPPSRHRALARSLAGIHDVPKKSPAPTKFSPKYTKYTKYASHNTPYRESTAKTKRGRLPVVPPCGCPDSKVIQPYKDGHARCLECNSSWLPSSRSIREIASDAKSSFVGTDGKKKHVCHFVDEGFTGFPDYACWCGKTPLDDIIDELDKLSPKRPIPPPNRTVRC